MNPFFREVDRLEEDLKPYARQAVTLWRLFLHAFLPAFLTAVWAGGNLSIGALVALGLSVAVTVLQQLDPLVPWGIILNALDKARWLPPIQQPAPPPEKGSGT